MITLRELGHYGVKSGKITSGKKMREKIFIDIIRIVKFFPGKNPERHGKIYQMKIVILMPR